MPPETYAFGSYYPMTETWLISNPRRKDVEKSITTLHGEVLKMMRNLMREPCMQDWVRAEEPDLAETLPDPIGGKDARNCANVHAEFSILGEALWFLTRWGDGDFHEMVSWKKEHLPYSVNRHDVRTALWNP